MKWATSFIHTPNTSKASFLDSYDLGAWYFVGAVICIVNVLQHCSNSLGGVEAWLQISNNLQHCLLGQWCHLMRVKASKVNCLLTMKWTSSFINNSKTSQPLFPVPFDWVISCCLFSNYKPVQCVQDKPWKLGKLRCASRGTSVNIVSNDTWFPQNLGCRWKFYLKC